MNFTAPDLTLYDYTLVNSVVFIIGEITIIILIGLFLLAVLLVTISLYSIRKGRMVFPGFLKAGFTAVEGLSKAIFRLFGLEDREMQAFFIQLHNSLSLKVFEAIPVSDRAVFLPQCLIRAMPCKSYSGGSSMRKLRPVHDFKCIEDPGKNWLPVVYRPGFLVYQTDGQKISSPGDHRYRVSFRSEGRDRHGR